jgi:hypothetical protein
MFSDGHSKPDIFALSTSSGWQMVADWVETIPPSEAPALHEFMEKGEYKGTDTLSEELTKVLEIQPPSNENVDKTIRNFLELMGTGMDDESATVLM